MKNSFLILLTSLISGQGFCDVLFIDLNFSDKEVAVAREAAEARGENLIVVPDMPTQTRRKLRGMYENVSRLHAEAQKSERTIASLKDKLARDPSLSTDAISKLMKVDPQQAGIKLDQSLKINSQIASEMLSGSKLLVDLRDRKADYEALRGQNVDFKNLPAQVDAQISQLQKNGSKVSSLLISGNHTESYFGEAGEIKFKDISNLNKKYPGVLSDVRSAYLWGCYTATVDEVEKWRGEFPSVNVVGFDNRSSTQRNQYNMSFLKKAMALDTAPAPVQEAANENVTPIDPNAPLPPADSKSSLSFVDKMLKAIPGIGKPFGLEGAVCLDDFYYSATSRKTRMLNDKGALCSPSNLAELNEQKYFVDYYYNASPGYEDVPEDVGSSPLRRFYSLAKKMATCDQAKKYGLYREAAINLIFYKNIAYNFYMKYFNDMKALQVDLLSRGVDLRIPDLSSVTTTRKEIINFGKTLNDVAKGSADSPAIQKMNSKYQALLVNLSCVPSHWIDVAGRPSDLDDPSDACMLGK